MPKRGMDEIVLVLDRSSSMYSVWSAVESAVPEFIREQRDVEGRDARFTLISFDTAYTVHYDRQPIQLCNVDRLPEGLEPRGMTALLDAVGRAINAVGMQLRDLPESERPENVIFAIYTDGEENSSREYTLQQVAEMVKRQQDKYSWKFLFLGANIDSFATGSAFGFNPLSTKGTHFSTSGFRASMRGGSVYTSSLRGGASEEVASQNFDEEYADIQGEDPEQTSNS